MLQGEAEDFDAGICFRGPRLCSHCKNFSLRTLIHARQSRLLIDPYSGGSLPSEALEL